MKWSAAALAFLALGCSPGDEAPTVEPGSPSARVFLIGVDGATWDIAEGLMEAGRMPHLRRLVEAGTRARLATMYPTLSPALWTTVATGKGFDKHGINSFGERFLNEEGEARRTIMHVTSNLRRTKALWNIMGDQGRRTAFVGWWVTWPAEAVNGYMVSSYMPLSQGGAAKAPTKGTMVPAIEDQTWPRELQQELVPLVRTAESVRLTDARRFMEIERKDLKRDIVEGFRWAYSADETYRAIAAHLLQTDPDLDLIGLYYGGVDVVSHRFWKFFKPETRLDMAPDDPLIATFRDVIPRYYEYFDDLLGDALTYVDAGDTVIVVSDHGFLETGSHRQGQPDGILVLSGANIEPGAELRDPQLVDIAPTVLALLGLPTARDMDGRVLTEAFTRSWKRDFPRDRVATFDTEEWREQDAIESEVSEELERRLKALGYLD